MSAKRVEQILDLKIPLLKDSEKEVCRRRSSAFYGLSKSAVSSVIIRKAEYIEAF